LRCLSETCAFFQHFSSGVGITRDQRLFAPVIATLAGRSIIGVLPRTALSRMGAGPGIASPADVCRQAEHILERAVSTGDATRVEMPVASTASASFMGAGASVVASAAGAGCVPRLVHLRKAGSTARQLANTRHHPRDIFACSMCFHMFPHPDVKARKAALASHLEQHPDHCGAHLTADGRPFRAYLEKRWANLRDVRQVHAVRAAVGPANVMLLGRAGSGKSHVMGAAAAHDTLNRGPTAIQVTGTTGMASVLLQGPYGVLSSTIFSCLGLGVIHYWTTLDELVARVEANPVALQTWHSLEKLYLDESANLSARDLDLLNRLAQYLKKNKHPFGGVQLIWSGGFTQMRPFATLRSSHPQLPAASQQHMFHADCFTSMFSLGNVNILVDQKRLQQGVAVGAAADSSVIFDELLRHMECGCLLAEHVALLQSPARWGTAMADTWAQVKADPVAAQSLNNGNDVPIYIVAFPQYAQEINRPLYNKINAVEYAVKSVDCGTSRGRHFDPGWFSEVKIKVGARMRVTESSRDLGIITGMLGDVVRVCITGTPDSTSPSQILVKSSFITVYLRLLDGRIIPVKPITLAADGSGDFTRTFIPLEICWACTVNRLQGITARFLIVDFRGFKYVGTAYTALSRGTCMENIVPMNFQKEHVVVDDTAIGFMVELNRCHAPDEYARLIAMHNAWDAEQQSVALGPGGIGKQSFEGLRSQRATAWAYSSRIVEDMSLAPTQLAAVDEDTGGEEAFRRAICGYWRTASMAASLSVRGEELGRLIEKHAVLQKLDCRGALQATGDIALEPDDAFFEEALPDIVACENAILARMELPVAVSTGAAMDPLCNAVRLPPAELPSWAVGGGILNTQAAAEVLGGGMFNVSAPSWNTVPVPAAGTAELARDWDRSVAGAYEKYPSKQPPHKHGLDGTPGHTSRADHNAVVAIGPPPKTLILAAPAPGKGSSTATIGMLPPAFSALLPEGQRLPSTAGIMPTSFEGSQRHVPFQLPGNVVRRESTAGAIPYPRASFLLPQNPALGAGSVRRQVAPSKRNHLAAGLLPAEAKQQRQATRASATAPAGSHHKQQQQSTRAAAAELVGSLYSSSAGSSAAAAPARPPCLRRSAAGAPLLDT